MTKTEIKTEAKERIMYKISAAFTTWGDEEITAEVGAEMDKQMRRIERLLGYEPGSWGRGV